MTLFPCFPEEKEKFLKSIKCQAGQTGGMKEEAMEKLLCPSMMCADFGALKREMEALEKAGIDLYHLDVMENLSLISVWACRISNISAGRVRSLRMSI